MQLLPHWRLTDPHPAFYDTESGSAIEQTAKVYAAMNELIKEYNAFVDSINTKITEYTAAEADDKELWRKSIRQEFQDFIDIVDLKVREIDNEFNRQKEYFDETVEKTVENVKYQMREFVAEMKQTGELAEILDESIERIQAIEVTPFMYGLTYDTMNNAHTAIQAAIDSGRDVYLPAGRYTIQKPLNITAYTHIRGAGAGKTVLTYYGGTNTPVFNITARYLAKPIIEGVEIRTPTTSDTTRIAIKCTGSTENDWGGSFVLRDSKIVGFSGTIMQFESAYNCLIQNVVVQSNGKFVLTTVNGTKTTNNFTNSLFFENVHYKTINDATVPIIFEMFNTRDITFHKCQFHDCDLLMSGETVKDTHFENCWFERVKTVHSLMGEDIEGGFQGASTAPTTTNCRFVTANASTRQKFDASAINFDYIEGEEMIMSHSGTERTFNDFLTNPELVVEEKQIFNPNDTYAKNNTLYKIGTKEMLFNAPINTITRTADDAPDLIYDISKIHKYSNRGLMVDVIGVVIFDDDSRIIFERKVTCLYGTYYPSQKTELFRSDWGTAKDDTFETLTSSQNEFTVGGGAVNKKKLMLFVSYNFLGV